MTDKDLLELLGELQEKLKSIKGSVLCEFYTYQHRRDKDEADKFDSSFYVFGSVCEAIDALEDAKKVLKGEI